MTIKDVCDVCDSRDPEYLARISYRSECSGQWTTYVGVICRHCAEKDDRNNSSEVLSKIVSPA